MLECKKKKLLCLLMNVMAITICSNEEITVHFDEMTFFDKCEIISTESPGFIVIGNGHEGEHGGHHHEVGEGKVDDQEIRGSLQPLGRHEHVHDDEVAADGDYSHDCDDEGQ